MERLHTMLFLKLDSQAKLKKNNIGLSNFFPKNVQFHKQYYHPWIKHRIVKPLNVSSRIKKFCHLVVATKLPLCKTKQTDSWSGDDSFTASFRGNKAVSSFWIMTELHSITIQANGNVANPHLKRGNGWALGKPCLFKNSCPRAKQCPGIRGKLFLLIQPRPQLAYRIPAGHRFALQSGHHESMSRFNATAASRLTFPSVSMYTDAAHRHLTETLGAREKDAKTFRIGAACLTELSRPVSLPASERLRTEHGQCQRPAPHRPDGERLDRASRFATQRKTCEGFQSRQVSFLSATELCISSCFYCKKIRPKKTQNGPVSEIWSDLSRS